MVRGWHLVFPGAVIRCAAAVLLAGTPLAVVAAVASPPLDFGVTVGSNINHFTRAGPVAAHLVLRPGARPRILVAFPAGNSGVAVWFEPVAGGARWVLSGRPQPLQASDAQGRALHGISATVSIAAPELKIRAAVLSSIRVLRDFEQLGTAPAAVTAAETVSGRTLSWSRARLDGAPGYRLTLEVTDGAVRDARILAGADGRIALRITALTGETPLTALAGAQLLSRAAGADTAARNTLAFLAYREKLLAGSWRFDTYFGRDTLIATRLLMPALSPPAVESALGAVLARLSPRGEVAHEEDIGERAILDHMERDGTRSAAAVFDYKMIDSNYLLAPVAAAWLLHDARAHDRAAAFLAAPAQAGSGARGAALLRNLRLLVQGAAPFAAQPQTSNLIALKSGFAVGDWRDSEDGLGGGRFPYDVNAVLVPAALEAAGELLASDLLGPYLNDADRQSLSAAASMARVWRAAAPPLFEVRLSHAAAAEAVGRYATAQGLPAAAAESALPSGELHFHALALDAAGAPIAVLHSDEGFALLFGALDPAAVDAAVGAVARPFPAGLMTGIGMVVANPAYCPPQLQARFSRNAYHGTVVWSWQQALFAAGLARQLARADLPAAVRTHLEAAQGALWDAIRATRALNNSELWSWTFADGRYAVAPFGAAAADADESNAAQLWSTVYLAVRAPDAGAAPLSNR
jgi:hypothetical protein